MGIQYECVCVCECVVIKSSSVLIYLSASPFTAAGTSFASYYKASDVEWMGQWTLRSVNIASLHYTLR